MYHKLEYHLLDCIKVFQIRWKQNDPKYRNCHKPEGPSNLKSNLANSLSVLILIMSNDTNVINQGCNPCPACESYCNYGGYCYGY